MYKEVLEKYGVKQTPGFTLSILTSEVGKLHQMFYKRERFGDEGYLGEEKVALGDLLTMAELLVEQKDLNSEELKLEGLERFDERIREVKIAQIKRRE